MTAHRIGAMSLLAVIALLAASCGVVSPNDASCAADPRVDDYGIVISQTNCADTDTLRFGANIPAVAGIAEATRLVVAATRQAYGSCASAEVWRSDMAGVIDALDELEAAFASGTGSALDSWRESSAPNRYFAALRARVFYDAGCAKATMDSATVQSLLETSGAAGAAYDRVRFAALPTTTPAGNSDLWYHSDEFGHLANIGLAIGNEAVRAEVVILGASPAKRGLDPDLLAESLGRPIINIAMAGLTPAVSGGWLADAIDAGLQPEQLLLAIASFELFSECSDTRTGLIRDRKSLRDAAFATVPGLRDVDGWMRLTGGASASNDGPVQQRYASEYRDSGSGRTLDVDGIREAAVENQTRIFGEIFASPDLCRPAFEDLTDTIVFATERGIDVVVVIMPMSENMAVLHPGGRAGHRAALDGLVAIADATNVSLIELDSFLTVDQFFDLNHPNRVGRELLTVELARALQDLWSD